MRLIYIKYGNPDFWKKSLDVVVMVGFCCTDVQIPTQLAPQQHADNNAGATFGNNVQSSRGHCQLSQNAANIQSGQTAHFYPGHRRMNGELDLNLNDINCFSLV